MDSFHSNSSDHCCCHSCLLCGKSQKTSYGHNYAIGLCAKFFLHNELRMFSGGVVNNRSCDSFGNRCNSSNNTFVDNIRYIFKRSFLDLDRSTDNFGSSCYCFIFNALGVLFLGIDNSIWSDSNNNIWDIFGDHHKDDHWRGFCLVSP